VSSSVVVEHVTQPSHQLGATLGSGRGWRRRLLLHHVPLALASVAVLVLFMGLSPFTNWYSHGDSSSGLLTLSFESDSRSFTSQLTVATGYLAVGLLGLTLLIGPANLLLRRRNPVSSHLRRDVGAWTAIVSVAHVIAGFQTQDGNGIFGFLDFFAVDGRPLTTSFGLGNWTGLAALVIVVGLLALSTNRSVRELKASRWKNLQRLNYTLFALVLLHAVFYGALSRMTSPFTLVLIVTVIAVSLGQVVGIRLWRRRSSRITARAT
jgi:sulfoxide reductase heme-binding subunit YedZ